MLFHQLFSYLISQALPHLLFLCGICLKCQTFRGHHLPKNATQSTLPQEACDLWHFSTKLEPGMYDASSWQMKMEVWHLKGKQSRPVITGNVKENFNHVSHIQAWYFVLFLFMAAFKDRLIEQTQVVLESLITPFMTSIVNIKSFHNCCLKDLAVHAERIYKTWYTKIQLHNWLFFFPH